MLRHLLETWRLVSEHTRVEVDPDHHPRLPSNLGFKKGAPFFLKGGFIREPTAPPPPPPKKKNKNKNNQLITIVKIYLNILIIKINK